MKIIWFGVLNPVSANQQKTVQLKIDSAKIDAIMELVGELVVSKGQILQATMNGDTKDIEIQFAHMDRIVRSLYQQTISTRMTSLKSLFEKLEQDVRALCGGLNKEIEFLTSGDKTELDRALIEQLNAPLMHLCRNSLDHGIEEPSLRETKGKSRTGKIEISAFNRGTQVIIEISDDGKGLDRESILKQARDKKLIDSEDENKFVDDSTIFDLIFEPGFSTATTVTKISGRGVGMDVVKSTIESMGGKIKIESTKDKGTITRLLLPLTTALTDCILVRIDTELVLIPLEYICEFTTTEAIETCRIDRGESLIKLRDEFIPLRDLNTDNPSTSTRKKLLVVISNRSKNAALHVDELLGHRQIVTKPLDRQFSQVKAFCGTAILSDGKIGLILDVDAIISSTSSLNLASLPLSETR